MKEKKIKEDDRNTLMKKHWFKKFCILFAMAALVLPIGHFGNAVAGAAPYECNAGDESIVGQVRNFLPCEVKEAKEAAPAPKG